MKSKEEMESLLDSLEADLKHFTTMIESIMEKYTSGRYILGKEEVRELKWTRREVILIKEKIKILKWVLGF